MRRQRQTSWCGWRGLLLLLLGLALPMPLSTGAAERRAAASPVADLQPPPLSPAELDQLAAELQDPAARARLVAELRALSAAARGAGLQAPRKEAPAASTTAAFDRFWRRIDAAANEVPAGAAAILDAPHLYRWAGRQIEDPAERRRWINAAVAFALVFAPAIAVEAILRRILARAVPRLPARRRDSRLVRALFALLGLTLDALPIAAFAAVAYGAVSLMPDGLTAAKITLSVLVEATVEARLALCLARAVLVPGDGGAVFLPVEAETGRYLYLWLRRFVLAGIFGYAIPEAGWWLGVPGALYALLLQAAGLVLALLAIIFVLQTRAAVARRLVGAAVAGSGWGRLRRSFGEIWHLLAIFYIVALYLIYALHIAGGFVYVLRASLASLVIIVAASLLGRSIAGLDRRGFALSPEIAAKFPALERRASRYLPGASRLAAAAVYGFAGLLVLSAWDVAAFAWLESSPGRQIAGRLLSTGLILAVAFAAWQILDAAIEHYLSGHGAAAAAARRRLPTLLPFLRTVALCLFTLLVGLTILSHLGINIAPLLAGAGIVGVAIGFGSQSLVKDVITGLFMLVEDQIAVGDVVDVGNGHSGVVEAMTIRTLRLRDAAGAVHLLPFSAVATVKNMSKDFGYVVARITISYREDIDRVVAILREVCDKLTEDPALQPLILDPFDYQGVDSLDEFWVTLLLRIRTAPMQQWTVGRAFNRLLKIAFEAQGIATRDPTPIMLEGAASAAGVEPRQGASPECLRA
jgi:moderate conductance mechanosensitive channel